MLSAIAGNVIGFVHEHHRLKSTVFPFFNNNGCRFADDSVMMVAIAHAITYGYDRSRHEYQTIAEVQGDSFETKWEQ